MRLDATVLFAAEPMVSEPNTELVGAPLTHYINRTSLKLQHITLQTKELTFSHSLSDYMQKATRENKSLKIASPTAMTVILCFFIPALILGITRQMG